MKITNRHRRLAAAIAILLASLQLAGCLQLQTVSALLPKSTPKPPVDNAPLRTSKAKGSSGLPPKEAAEACFATALELQANGYASESQILFERARQLDPREKRVAHHLALLYDQQGNDSRAEAEYHKALEFAPKDADVLNDWGYYHYHRGNWPEAEKQFRAAIEISPEHERAWVNLGMALGEQGRYQESFEAFAKVVGPAAAHSNVGVLLAAHERNTEAMTAFGKALAIQPNLPQARAFLAYLQSPTHTAQARNQH